ncbi:MAG: hypothetical protein AB8B94_07870 [Hyphomicrobiales bacterium]
MTPFSMSDILQAFDGADAWRWYAVPPSIYMEFDTANRYGFYGCWDVVKLNFLSNFGMFVKPNQLLFVDQVIDELAKVTDEGSRAFEAINDRTLSFSLAEVLGDTTDSYIDAETQLFIDTATNLIPICVETFQVLDSMMRSKSLDDERRCRSNLSVPQFPHFSDQKDQQSSSV